MVNTLARMINDVYRILPYGFPMKSVEPIKSVHKPDQIRALFIGEFRSAGGAFFYTGNNRFTVDTRKAFEQTLGIEFTDNQEFFEFFKARGFYMDSLVLESLTGVDKAVHRKISESCIPDLAKRIRVYQPDVIVIYLKRIWLYVAEAIDQSGIEPQAVYPLSFAENGRQRKFIDNLSEILTTLI